MKYVSLLMLLAWPASDLVAQTTLSHDNAAFTTDKPVIDSNAIHNWPSICDFPAFSNDGNYLMYRIDNQPVGAGTLVIRSVKDKWERQFVLKNTYGTGFFSADDKSAIYVDNDTLHIVTLGTSSEDQALAIRSHKQQSGGKGEWLAYEPKDQANVLMFRSLVRNRELRFEDVKAYSFGNTGDVLVLQTERNGTKALEWLEPGDERAAVIWSSAEDSIGAYGLDEQDEQIAFIVQSGKDSQAMNSLWYYRTGMDKAVLKTKGPINGLDGSLSIANSAPSFNAAGGHIFFTLARPTVVDTTPPPPNAVMVDVWRYNDKVLRFPEVEADAARFLPRKEFVAVVAVKGDQVIRLEGDDEHVIAFPEREGDLVLVAKSDSGKISDIGDRYWENAPVSYYVRSLEDGSRKLVAKGLLMGHFGFNVWSPMFSPKGEYLLYYDILKDQYFSYNTRSGGTQHISVKIPTRVTDNRISSAYQGLLLGTMKRGQIPVGIAGWVKDRTALIYDNYDIWWVDLAGRRAPVNITRGYGERHHIQLRAALERDGFKYRVHRRRGSLLLAAFNDENKHSGIYRAYIRKRREPRMLVMGPWRFSRLEKAVNANKWIVKRESSTEAPNYLWTDNLRDYQALTDLQPQRSFNWMQAELVNFKQLDGTPTRGILYKPENFDPQKRYPVIFNYYETWSDELFAYHVPRFVGGDLEIPWFVSRGYLVFRPDIHYQPGYIGRSAYNSIVAGADELSKQPWVDTARMGLQGHSFGGYETNYLITHSQRFAAAVAGAAVSDMVSAHGGLQMGARTGGESCETGQLRMASTLWDRPDLYIENSPVFKTNQVSTPLLMMHNRPDPIVPWEQSLEFYLGLRRLDKKAWFLQYDKGGHGVQGPEAVDYTIRITQFFDHYLKAALPPRWMTDGVPPEMKGKMTGYELDGSGTMP